MSPSEIEILAPALAAQGEQSGIGDWRPETPDAIIEASPDPKPKHPRFYMVWSPQRHAPVVKHKKFFVARYIARRYAEKNPGCEFVVLQSTWGITVPPADPEAAPESEEA